MNLEKLNDWLQLVAAIGVIAGLALVAYELRQNQALTRAQLNSDSLAAMEQAQRARQQEPLARAIAKTYESPLELTATERVTLDGYYKENMQLVAREGLFVQRGIYENEMDVPIQIFARHVLSTEYGQVWWADFKGTLPGPFVRPIDEIGSDWLEEQGFEVSQGRKNEIRNHYGL